MARRVETCSVACVAEKNKSARGSWLQVSGGAITLHSDWLALWQSVVFCWQVRTYWLSWVRLLGQSQLADALVSL